MTFRDKLNIIADEAAAARQSFLLCAVELDQLLYSGQDFTEKRKERDRIFREYLRLLAKHAQIVRLLESGRIEHDQQVPDNFKLFARATKKELPKIKG